MSHKNIGLCSVACLQNPRVRKHHGLAGCGSHFKPAHWGPVLKQARHA
jgi:hypothetical protein